ncbi:hypothetical protein N7474_008999 [Penicillium riverlandense]|uniref:uncharacterized protein n=1 Tax=Penicillium riverlandense TaxID=1903569 RepID=UPI00254760A4|nr:uncharacterized protein N7474_008999 [Penicillium riverlandense]KAJ5807730.1 hypothetical protein N7474_008999 [Penicillium riverlandense]
MTVLRPNMLSSHLFLLFALLGSSLASEVTIPWVGQTSEGNVWEDWHGELAAKNDNSTTYYIQPGCVTDTTTTGACYTLDPPITLIVAPTSYQVITTNPDAFLGYQSSSCTLTGSPSPTKAHCFWTDHAAFRGSTFSDSATIDYPDSLGLNTIYSVTLTYGTPVAKTATATSIEVTATAESTGTANGATTTQGPSSTTTSSNIGAKNAAPMMVLGGVLVGVVFWA